MHDTGHIVGFVPIARPTFDLELAGEVTRQVRAQLTAEGLSLAGPEALVSTLDQTRAVARSFMEQPLDLLIVFQATFADSTLALHLAEQVDAPLLLWAVPEERTGGRLRLNSLCGINLAGHALTRAGHLYDYVYARPDDPAALERVCALAKAGRVRRLLRKTRIGRIGENPEGFTSCLLDREGLRQRLGLDVVHCDLKQVFEEARLVDPQQVDDMAATLGSRLDGLDRLDQGALRGTLGVYLALERLASRERLSGLAVRCWPEFFTELGCAACGAMSMLSDEMIPCGCEADVNGTVTQFILQTISGEPAFGSDLVSFDVEADHAVLWHCGLAPLSMADPAARPRGTIHSNRRLPLLMEFPLKPGPVTLARLSQATGDYRLVIGRGEMLQAPPSFSGTSGVLRFERPAGEVLDTILSQGLEHHISLTYGDHLAALAALAKLLHIPVLYL